MKNFSDIIQELYRDRITEQHQPEPGEDIDMGGAALQNTPSTGTTETGGPTAIGIPTTTLADTEYIVQRWHVPAGETLLITTAGVQTAANTAPAGLTFEVDDETNGANLVSENSKHATGDPLAQVAGPVDVAFAVENDSGGSVDASGYVEFKVE